MKSYIETYLRIKPLLINSNNNTKNNSTNISTLSSYIHNNNNINDDSFSETNGNSINSNSIEYDINKNIFSIKIPENLRTGYVNNLKKTYDFHFNGIFDVSSTQEEIFEIIGKKVIKNSIEGYNSTVFCYGQTGSGKTYTMCGSKNWRERGIIPRLLINLFKKIRELKNIKFDVYISYMEIYNENAYDLLDNNNNNNNIDNWKKITVYEDNNNNIMLKNLGLIKVENEQQALDLLITGNYIRHIGSTTMNNASSRSHAIFNIIIESNDNNLIRVSKLNLVDLAGSERIKSTNNNTSIERKYINLSLSFLEQVIIALNSKDRTHIPYRNSLMTTILKDSLGGNSRTILIATISSNINYIEESISSIRFSVRCSKVTNNVSINECMDLNVLVNKLIGENERLKKLLNEKGINDNNDKNCLVLNPNPLNDYEKDECKILISEYLNNNKKEPIKAKNVNQLYYIIDFLIEYIDKKETKYNSKMKEIIEEKKKLKIIEEKENEKFKKINEIIKKNGLKKYFKEFFDDKNNNNN